MRIDQIELTGSLSISASLATNPLVVNNNYLFVSNTGNVGIGSKTPTSKLVVTGSVAVRGELRATTMSGSFTGSIKLSTIPLGTSETNIVLVNGGGNLVYRDNLSLTGAQGNQGAQGATGANAGITTYTNPADNRVLTSVSSTEINAESNLTFDGSILDVNTTAAFKLPVGTTEERPTLASNGMIRLNTTLGGLEVYDSDWYLIFYTRLVIDYLIIAGGGGGASTGGGGGGAGGYRTTVGTSGGNSSSESKVTLTRGVQYVITVGAGAPQNSGIVDNGFSGSNSSISGSGLTSIISIGGGGGSRSTGINGGSGGGGSGGFSGGTATISQGFNGGAGTASLPIGGGGGGASAIGVNATSNSGGNGGNGLGNEITGISVTRAGGGGGGNHMNSTVGSGGTGGGGTASPFGSANARGGAGTINTGSGGGGGSGQTGVSFGFGGAGGTGVVIIRAPFVATNTTGSPTITSFGGFYVYQFNGTGTITF